MVRLGSGILLVLCASAVLAAPAYQVDKREVAFGESVSLTLNARPGMLDKIDLAPLAQNFELRDQSRSQDSHSESLTVTLYPRTVGRLSLRIPGLPGQAPTIQVDAQSNLIPKIRFGVELDPAQPVARQPFKLTIEACEDGGLMWKRPALTTAEGLYIRDLNERQLQVMRDGERCTAHRWQWSITPTAAGAFALPVPILEAGKFGEQLRYPPPRVAFEVKAVPGWLPLEMAVGKVSVHADAIPAKWPMNRPLERHLVVQGAYSQAALRKILALQLAGQPAFARYAPQVEPLPPDDDSATPGFDVTLYAQPGETGRLAFPALTFPWFDAERGRIQDTELPSASVEVFDPGRVWWLRIGLGTLTAVVLGLSAAYLHRAWRLLRDRRQALAAIRAANTLEQLAGALRSFPRATGQVQALTLAAWLAESSPLDEALARAVKRLELACYGDGRDDLAAIREELLTQLMAMKPRRLGAHFQRRIG